MKMDLNRLLQEVTATVAEIKRLQERDRMLGWIMHTVKQHAARFPFAAELPDDEQAATALVLACYHEKIKELEELLVKESVLDREENAVSRLVASAEPNGLDDPNG